jgi:N-acetylneuraminic acid mutarotase
MWASSWTDVAGNLWLFGGEGVPTPSGVPANFNDLWKYSGGEWTWVGGSNQIEQTGVYGTLATPAPGNVPGARNDAVSWTDPSGNFWLFGGLGVDSTGNEGWLNDLWKYSGGQWTWMGGSDTEADYPNCRAGVYGTQGVPAPSNMPGARTDAVGWTDSSGNLWLFGGLGFASESAEEVGGLCHGPDILNDLWKYSPATSMWTWISGSNIFSQLGTYGTLGTAAPGNVPGARGDAVAWTDTTGNLWLFGGEGNDSNGTLCENGGGLACDLNDLWKYTPATNMWTWLGGSNLIAQPGRYGTQGVAAPSNIPGARWLAVGWTDAAGDFWLFGGEGFDSVGTGAGVTDLNDLWKYSGGQWTWMSGSDIANQLGTYGTQGTADPGNSPGAREAPAAWIDPSGNLWLFGGYTEWVLPEGKFNDLWVYHP